MSLSLHIVMLTEKQQRTLLQGEATCPMALSMVLISGMLQRPPPSHLCLCACVFLHGPFNKTSVLFFFNKPFDFHFKYSQLILFNLIKYRL